MKPMIFNGLPPPNKAALPFSVEETLHILCQCLLVIYMVACQSFCTQAVCNACLSYNSVAFLMFAILNTCFWESKHIEGFCKKYKNKKLVLFYFYVQESIAHNNIAHIRSKR